MSVASSSASIILLRCWQRGKDYGQNLSGSFRLTPRRRVICEIYCTTRAAPAEFCELVFLTEASATLRELYSPRASQKLLFMFDKFSIAPPARKSLSRIRKMMKRFFHYSSQRDGDAKREKIVEKSQQISEAKEKVSCNEDAECLLGERAHNLPLFPSLFWQTSE